jgi:hypothetical protein
MQEHVDAVCQAIHEAQEASNAVSKPVSTLES